MPQYCYHCVKCKKGTSRTLPMSKAKWRPKCCGVKMERDFVAERPGTQRPACWPMKSDAAGCHPDQIPEAIAAAERKGVSINFTRDGRAIFTSQKHRKEYCERVVGLFDRSGSYGDPQRGGSEKYL